MLLDIEDRQTDIKFWYNIIEKFKTFKFMSILLLLSEQPFSILPTFLSQRAELYNR